ATLGLYQLSTVDNRKGYAGYELLAELSEAKWDVRNRVLNSKLGTFATRSPRTAGYRADDDDDERVSQCQAWVDECFSENRLSHLTQPGGPCEGYGLERPPGGVTCSKCEEEFEEGAQGLYWCRNTPPGIPGNEQPRITLCALNLSSKTETCEVLAHEMIHWCDDQRLGGCPYKRSPGDGKPEDEWNWACPERACAEVRAAAFSRQCCVNGSKRRPNQTFRECVSELASGSLQANGCDPRFVRYVMRSGNCVNTSNGDSVDLDLAEKLCEKAVIPGSQPETPQRRPR
ncbi:MAG: hypothetical protein EDM82_04300, partial [Cyanobacteria bacterium CYA]